MNVQIFILNNINFSSNAKYYFKIIFFSNLKFNFKILVYLFKCKFLSN